MARADRQTIPPSTTSPPPSAPPNDEAATAREIKRAYLGDMAPPAGEANDVIWYLYRVPSDWARSSPTMPYPGKGLVKSSAPPTWESVQDIYGGGIYRIIAKSRQSGSYLSEMPSGGWILELDGAEKPGPLAEPTAAPQPSNEFAQLRAEVQALRAELTTRATQPGPQLGELDLIERVMHLVHSVAPPAAAAPAAQLESIIGLYQRGLEDGKGLEGGSTSTADLIREALPIVRAMITPQVRTMPPSAAARVTRAESAAPRSATPGAATPDQRQLLLVEMLSRAVQYQVDAEEFAGTLDALLSEPELQALVQLSGAQLLQAFAPLLAQYQELSAPHVEGYVDQVIAALRTEPEGDAEPASATFTEAAAVSAS